ncbi:homology to integrase [Colletotrichum incanum]|nr:homology to integrase [Colletotrichum incanum]
MLVVKTINDTTGLDGIIPTLLIFGAALQLYVRLVRTYTGPYRLITINGKDYTVKINGLRNNYTKDTIVVTTSLRSPVTVTTAPPAYRPYGRLRKTLPLNALLQETNVPNYLSPDYSSAFVSTKEESNKAFTAVITTPSEPFKLSTKAKINALVGRRVFKFVTFNPAAHTGRIFKSRIVNKVKGKNTDKPYEKLRLII